MRGFGGQTEVVAPRQRRTRGSCAAALIAKVDKHSGDGAPFILLLFDQ